MCGFITVINPSNSAVDIISCRQATKILTHRGPDDKGEWISDPSDVYMGFRRLSIIDLSEEANQPMIGKTGVVLVFNGEIYNFLSLRSELEAIGCRFRTHGDTEVLLQAIETWGIEALRKLEGMFAFVLWDNKNKRATIVRDFFGIKPLYLWEMPNGGVAIASEIKGFYALPGFNPRFNVDALPEYLRFRCLCAEQTLLKDVYQVQPGEAYIYDQKNGNLNRSFYWDIIDNMAGFSNQGNENTLIDGFLHRFKGTVERHLIADVKVGTQFSGGVDSTLTSAISAKNLGAQLTGFHCHIPHETIGEKAFASAIAEYLKMPVQYTTLNSELFFSDLLEKLTWHMDEPIGHPNAVGVYLVSKLAHGQVKVLLSGEGADETFAGYYRYRRIVFADLLRHKPFILKQITPFTGLFPKKLQKMINTASKTSSNAQILYDTQFVPPSVMGKLFSNPEYEERSIYRRRSVLNRYESQSTLNRCQLFDIKTYLPSLLTRQDKMSMAASIENRVPFLTPEICTFAFGLPGYVRCNGLSTKILLKKSLTRYIPNKFVYRLKRGFELPLGEWFLTDTGKARLDPLTTSNSRLFDVFERDEVTRLIKKSDGSHDTADLLWILLTLNMWMDMFLGDKNLVAAAAYT
jgi:asparagine synthase (glutamine-hydrolysing)